MVLIARRNRNAAIGVASGQATLATREPRPTLTHYPGTLWLRFQSERSGGHGIAGELGDDEFWVPVPAG